MAVHPGELRLVTSGLQISKKDSKCHLYSDRSQVAIGLEGTYYIGESLTRVFSVMINVFIAAGSYIFCTRTGHL